MCEGFYLENINYGNEIFNEKPLIKDDPGVANIVVNIGDKTYLGTYKHTNCSTFTDKDNHTCQKCRYIPNLHSFKEIIQLRARRGNAKCQHLREN